MKDKCVSRWYVISQGETCTVFYWYGIIVLGWGGVSGESALGIQLFQEKKQAKEQIHS